MRTFGFTGLVLLAILDLSWAQVEIPSSHNAALPMFRPALIGTGPQALINRIDGAELVKNGQKDAAVMFSCTVLKGGNVISTAIYRGTPDSKLLADEVLKRLSAAANTRFIPAIYNHLPVSAMFYGTVTFMVVDGKPRLRIFSNQERAEVSKESDFIGPQPFYGAESKFDGFHYPTGSAPVPVDGSAEVRVKVDAAGNLQDLKLVSETPPFLGFGDAAANDFRAAKFIPAFRDGKPIASDVALTVYYKEKNF